MNTSQFMDKQIMDLSSSSAPLLSTPRNGKDFIDLMNQPQDDDHHKRSSVVSDDGSGDNGFDNKKEEIMPSYDFQPIRPTSGLSQSTSNLAGFANTARIWSSADSKTNSTSPIRNYGSLDSIEPAKIILEKDQNVCEAAMVTEIDRTMKKHVDNLLHALEGISARLTQLETRSRNLENSVDDLKVFFGNNHGSIDGKMRQMENILREVQTGVLVIKDKQEIVEAQLQVAKQQVSNVDHQSETHNSVHIDSAQPATSAPLQSQQQLPLSASILQHPPAPIVPPLTLPQQNLPPPVQHPNQYPSSQIPSVPQREPYFSPPGQTQEAPNQQYQVPPTQQPQLPPAAPPHQPYQPVPQPQYSQLPQPPQLQPSLGHHPEEILYLPSQNYPPNLRQPPSQPPTVSAPSQQYYGAPPHMYEPPSSRSSSGFSTGYGPQPGPTEPYPYGGSPSQFGSNTTMKPHQLSSPAIVQSSGSGYPQLPTARVLPHALPTASRVGGGSGSSASGNRVPVDDVIDKVINMGFPRDHVRATVRKLTENGQSVDLNVVLDKLMNDGEVHPQRGWPLR